MDADYAGLLVYKRSTIGYIFGKYLLRDIVCTWAATLWLGETKNSLWLLDQMLLEVEFRAMA